MYGLVRPNRVMEGCCPLGTYIDEDVAACDEVGYKSRNKTPQ